MVLNVNICVKTDLGVDNENKTKSTRNIQDGILPEGDLKNILLNWKDGGKEKLLLEAKK
jgi:hypothetical protein